MNSKKPPNAKTEKNESSKIAAIQALERELIRLHDEMASFYETDCFYGELSKSARKISDLLGEIAKN